MKTEESLLASPAMTTTSESEKFQRILSVDILRGLTLFGMCFVDSSMLNAGLPWWMKHSFMSADKIPLITFPDLGVPFFLFVMGLAISLSMEKRLERQEPLSRILWHIVVRSLSLIWIGTVVVGYYYDQAVTGLTPASWYLFGFLAAVGLLGTARLVQSDKRGKIVAGWVLRVISFSYLLWASYITRGFIPNTPAFPRSTLGHLGIAFLIVSVLWLLTRQATLARLGIYGLMLGVYYHLKLDNGFLTLWFPKTIQYWHIANIIYFSSIVLAGTFIGDLFLLRNRQTCWGQKPKRYILGFGVCLLLASAMADTNFFATFVGLRRLLFFTSFSVLGFLACWQAETLLANKKFFTYLAQPFVDLGRNPIYSYLIQFGLGAFLALILRDFHFIEVVPNHIILGSPGWTSLFLLTIPYTLLFTGMVMLTNRSGIFLKL